MFKQIKTITTFMDPAKKQKSEYHPVKDWNHRPSKEQTTYKKKRKITVFYHAHLPVPFVVQLEQKE